MSASGPTFWIKSKPISSAFSAKFVVGDGARLTRNGHAANLGEYVKRNEEAREPGTHHGLAVDQLFHRVRGSLNVLGILNDRRLRGTSELWLIPVATIAAFNARSEAIVRLGSWAAPAPPAPPVMRALLGS
jgi:hypothetical protein